MTGHGGTAAFSGAAAPWLRSAVVMPTLVAHTPGPVLDAVLIAMVDQLPPSTVTEILAAADDELQRLLSRAGYDAARKAELDQGVAAWTAARDKAVASLAGTSGLQTKRYATHRYVVTLDGTHIGLISPGTISGSTVKTWKAHTHGFSADPHNVSRSELGTTFASKPKAAAALETAYREHLQNSETSR